MPPVKPLPELWIAWHHFKLCLISHWGEANVRLKGANKFWQSPPNSRVCGNFRNGGCMSSTLAKNSSERLCTHKPFQWFSNGRFINLAIKTPLRGARGAPGLNCCSSSHCGGVWPCFWWVTRRGSVRSPLALSVLWQAEVGVSVSARSCCP